MHHVGMKIRSCRRRSRDRSYIRYAAKKGQRAARATKSSGRVDVNRLRRSGRKACVFPSLCAPRPTRITDACLQARSPFREPPKDRTRRNGHSPGYSGTSSANGGAVPGNDSATKKPAMRQAGSARQSAVAARVHALQSDRPDVCHGGLCERFRTSSNFHHSPKVPSGWAFPAARYHDTGGCCSSVTSKPNRARAAVPVK
jgi:hypothetical protein